MKLSQTRKRVRGKDKERERDKERGVRGFVSENKLRVRGEENLFFNLNSSGIFGDKQNTKYFPCCIFKSWKKFNFSWKLSY